MNWNKLFSVFGIPIACLVAVLTGVISETVVPGTTTIGMLFGLALGLMAIYGVAFGFAIAGFLAFYTRNPVVELAPFVALAIMICAVFFLGYRAPFSRIVWAWIASREKPGQARVM